MTEKTFQETVDRSCLEQLWQLRQPTWDGNLLSKANRDWLIDKGLARQMSGWNVLTEAGLWVLVATRMLNGVGG